MVFCKEFLKEQILYLIQHWSPKWKWEHNIKQNKKHTKTSADHVPTGDISNVDDNIELWCPQLKLPLPGIERGQGNYQQEGTVKLLSIVQVRQKRHNLNRFAQTHLISQDHTVVPAQNTWQL